MKYYVLYDYLAARMFSGPYSTLEQVAASINDDIKKYGHLSTNLQPRNHVTVTPISADEAIFLAQLLDIKK